MLQKILWLFSLGQRERIYIFTKFNIINLYYIRHSHTPYNFNDDDDDGTSELAHLFNDVVAIVRERECVLCLQAKEKQKKFRK